MLENDWQNFFLEESAKPYFKNLMLFLQQEYLQHEIFPKQENLFNALKHTSLKEVKVVIIGQDPYHQPNQANGLAFSVEDGLRLPPSLKNMFKEIEKEFETQTFKSGNLERWAKQGVLLLNTVLSVRKDLPNSHSKKGWEEFTQNIIKEVCKKPEPVVFLLWGKNAYKFESLITNPKHMVLKSSHPSPLSAHRGFFGNNHFKIANEHLKQNGLNEIDWR